MYIYIFKSDLFPNERRKIVLSFQLDHNSSRNLSFLLDLVNHDNNYVKNQGRWYLTEEC